MYAMLVNVTINDPEAAPKLLEEQVVPRVSQAPGFIAGYWMRPQEDRGWSVVVFESEQAARAVADTVVSPPTGEVTVNNVDVQEIVAHA
jgi:heme-degrading monooxygenase HmoA